jgi:S1-C subfamily serine protease
VIVKLAGKDVADVYVYTEILAGLEADVPVEAVVRRGEHTLTLTITPASR